MGRPLGLQIPADRPQVRIRKVLISAKSPAKVSIADLLLQFPRYNHFTGFLIRRQNSCCTQKSFSPAVVPDIAGGK